MKLIFTKDANNEIDVKIQKGTIIEDFSYTEMVRQLLVENDFDETDFTNLGEEEQTRLKAMIVKITRVFNQDNEEHA